MSSGCARLQEESSKTLRVFGRAKIEDFRSLRSSLPEARSDSLLTDLPHDAERLRLETLTGNEIGISFYRSQGFETVGEHEFMVDGSTYPTIVFERVIDG